MMLIGLIIVALGILGFDLLAARLGSDSGAGSDPGRPDDDEVPAPTERVQA